MAVAARRAAVPGEHDSWVRADFGICRLFIPGAESMGYIGMTAQLKKWYS
jgi:hypothetical protein